ncbi:MAG: replicative DNA helicase [Rhizobiales bacterium]|nr:replicative DNA helicase [Hyphomicrobiales bacterium]NRB13006.1 replicative DNA helicase [Hyphomicrobiales bacterium]
MNNTVALNSLVKDQLNQRDEIEFRNLPNNIEAEQGLLGAILINNDAYDKVSSFLREEHFFEALHGRIYDTASQLIAMGKNASPVTLKTHFENDPVIQEIGGTKYLARLAADATSVINAKDYGQTIYDLAVRRGLINVGEDIVNNAYEADVNSQPQQQIEIAEQELYKLAETDKYGGGFQSFSTALTEVVIMAEAAYKRDGNLSGISTGLHDLDKMMGGLQKSDLIILAGRPSMGKTALATNIAFNIAKAYRQDVTPDGSLTASNGGVVAFFSLEMSAEQLATRIIAEQAEISSSNIRRGDINEEQFVKLVETTKILEEKPLFIDDTGGLTIGQVAARARRLKRQHGLDLIILDYIQLLAGSGKANANRVQEVTEITMGLKSLAKELEVPIIALSQLNRGVEQRDDKRPMLSDLRESGSIEQDADVVAFVYREEYYHERSQPKEGTPEHAEWQVKGEDVYGKAEVIIAKQRHGPVGHVTLQFEGQFTRFSDLQKDDFSPMRYE